MNDVLNRTESIRLYCLDCTAGSPGAINACSFEKECSLWPLRMGAKQGINKSKLINKYCRDCLGGARPGTCSTNDCSLHAFRTGVRTSTAGVGGVFRSRKYVSEGKVSIGMEALLKRLSGAEKRASNE